MQTVPLPKLPALPRASCIASTITLASLEQGCLLIVNCVVMLLPSVRQLTDPICCMPLDEISPDTSDEKCPQIVDWEMEGTPLHDMVNWLPPLPLLWEMEQLVMDIAVVVVMRVSAAMMVAEREMVEYMAMIEWIRRALRISFEADGESFQSVILKFEVMVSDWDIGGLATMLYSWCYGTIKFQCPYPAYACRTYQMSMSATCGLLMRQILLITYKSRHFWSFLLWSWVQSSQVSSLQLISEVSYATRNCDTTTFSRDFNVKAELRRAHPLDRMIQSSWRVKRSNY